MQGKNLDILDYDEMEAYLSSLVGKTIFFDNSHKKDPGSRQKWVGRLTAFMVVLNEGSLAIELRIDGFPKPMSMTCLKSDRSSHYRYAGEFIQAC